MTETLLLLLAAHFVADYPLQGDFLAKAKNKNVDLGLGSIWFLALLGHSLIHSAAVLLITGSLIFAAIELVGHFFIDLAKCNNCISFNLDQYWHLSFKVLYIILIGVSS